MYTLLSISAPLPSNGNALIYVAHMMAQQHPNPLMIHIVFSQAAVQVPEDCASPLNPNQRGNYRIHIHFHQTAIVGDKYGKSYFFSPLLFASLPVSAAAVPRPGRHRRPMTAQKAQKDKSAKCKKIVLAILTVIVILGILTTAGYFSKWATVFPLWGEITSITRRTKKIPESIRFPTEWRTRSIYCPIWSWLKFFIFSLVSSFRYIVNFPD